MIKRSSHLNHRRGISKRAKHLRKLFTGFIFAFIVCISGSAFFVSAHGISDADSIHTYYKSIEIHKGDTLWEIAEQTKPQNCGSTAEYVQLIKDMNQLESDHIESGQHLIIAYNI